MSDDYPSSYSTHIQLQQRRKKYTFIGFLLALVALCVGCILVYNLPQIHSRLAWRVEALWAKINPHEEQIFVPQEQAKSQATLLAATQIARQAATLLAAATSTPMPQVETPTLVSTILDTSDPLSTTLTPQTTIINPQPTVENPQSTIKPTHTPPPLPPVVPITAVKNEDQHNRYK